LASVRMTNTTAVSAGVIGLVFDQLPKDKHERSDPWVRFDISSSILDVVYGLLTHQEEGALLNGKARASAELEDLLGQLVTWRGEQNVHSGRSGEDETARFCFYSEAKGVERGWVHGPTDLAAWSKFWGSPEPGSVVGTVRFQDGNLASRVNTAPENLT